jgi:hypothetical protein
MTLGEIRNRLLRAIDRILGGVSGKVSDDHSLTVDLGMDSLHLMELFQIIDAEIGNVELMPWLILSSSGGRDTVDGLCRYLITALEGPELTRINA